MYKVAVPSLDLKPYLSRERPADEVEEPKIETVEYSSQWWISAVVLLLVINILVIVAAYYTCKHRV